MKIDNINIVPFNIKMLNPFKTANSYFLNRSGWYVKIYYKNLIGIGEISPLKDFIIDYNQSINKKINLILEKIEKIKNNLDLDSYLLILNENTQNYPSINFGFETAIYDLISKIENVSLSKYLNSNALENIYFNTVYDINNKNIKPNKIIKLKMSLKSIDKSIKIIDKIFEKNSDTKLRLDFNGTLDLSSAIIWIKKLSGYNVDYIEQPLAFNCLDDLCELRLESDISIAVDESLTDINSAYNIINKKAADVFIIKPMLSGGYFKSKTIYNLAKKENIRSIITTTLESKVGFLANLHIASALEIDEYCGLSTWSLYDNKPPAKIKNNAFDIPITPGLGL